MCIRDSPKALWNMRNKLIGMGGAQVMLTTAAVTVIMVQLGQPGSVALLIGMLAALSSTASVLQTLTEKKLMRTQGGRSAFSVLLMQDIAVIPMLAVIPLLELPTLIGPSPNAALFGVINPETAVTHEGAAEPLISLVQSLPGWGATLLTRCV